MLNALTTKAYVKVTEAIRSFKENNEGVTAIEYGLIAIAVAALIATRLLAVEATVKVPVTFKSLAVKIALFSPKIRFL